MEEYSAQLAQSISKEITNTPLMRYLVKHSSAQALISLVRKKRGRKLSRSQRRRFINKRRRWFTDNIIMHHRRVHKKNREIALDPPEKTIKKRKKLKRKKEKAKEVESSNKKEWQSNDQLQHRGTVITGRIDARRLKARSRWLSVST